MDQKTQEAFYIGAAVYLNLDSDEVDHILGQAGLNVDEHSARQCRQAVKDAEPERFEKMRQFPPPF